MEEDSKPAFGEFGTQSVVVEVTQTEGEEPNLPVIKEWEPHLKSHGGICSDNRGHFCPKLECEVNQDPRNLDPVFDAIDRKEY